MAFGPARFPDLAKAERAERPLEAKWLHPAKSLAPSPATSEPWIGATPLEGTHESSPTPQTQELKGVEESKARQRQQPQRLPVSRLWTSLPI